MDAMTYELFLRKAFSLKGKTFIGREGDPACLATSVYFHEDDINTVKIGVGYAFAIFKDDLTEYHSMDLNETEAAYIGTFLSTLLLCDSIKCIHDLITDFNDHVVSKYYNKSAGDSNN